MNPEAIAPQDRARLEAIVAALERLKGQDTCVLDVRSLPVPTSFLVISTAGNPKQMRAMLEAVEEALLEKPFAREGQGETRWAVLDYGSVIVHVLSPEARAFYELEELWGERVVTLTRVLDASSG